MGNPEPIKSIISRIMNELFLRSYDLDNDADFWRVSPNGRCVMEERMIKKIRAIGTCAELIQENYSALGITNTIPNLAVKVILETCKELLNDFEQAEREKLRKRI